jgi:hypothetical protein
VGIGGNEVTALQQYACAPHKPQGKFTVINRYATERRSWQASGLGVATRVQLKIASMHPVN